MLLNSWMRFQWRHLAKERRQRRSSRRGRGTSRQALRGLRSSIVEDLEARVLLTIDGPAKLLRDVDVITPQSSPSEIVQSGANIFFTADDGKLGASAGLSGNELFIISGSNPPRLVVLVYRKNRVAHFVEAV